MRVFKDNVTVLGNMVSAEGVHVDPAETEKVHSKSKAKIHHLTLIQTYPTYT